MNFPIGLSLCDKFKLLRKREGLSQRALCDIAGIPHGTYKHLESGRNKTIGADLLGKVCQHPRFFPYAMWLLVDELTDEQAQQVFDFLQSVKR